MVTVSKLTSCLVMVACYFSIKVHASTIMEVDKVCPIDGEKFTATVAMSGTSWGRRFDLKQLGPIIQPWPIPICPKSGFAMYREDFSESELEHLKLFVMSEQYQSMRMTHTPHYLASRIATELGASGWHKVSLLLNATWEAENKNQDLEAAYQVELEQTLIDYIKTLETNTDEWFTAYILLANCKRRQMDFDSAEETTNIILSEYKDDERSHIVEMTQRLLKLIREKNNKPRGIDAASDEYINP